MFRYLEILLAPVHTKYEPGGSWAPQEVPLGSPPGGSQGPPGGPLGKGGGGSYLARTQARQNRTYTQNGISSTPRPAWTQKENRNDDEADDAGIKVKSLWLPTGFKRLCQILLDPGLDPGLDPRLDPGNPGPQPKNDMTQPGALR